MVLNQNPYSQNKTRATMAIHAARVKSFTYAQILIILQVCHMEK